MKPDNCWQYICSPLPAQFLLSNNLYIIAQLRKCATEKESGNLKVRPFSVDFEVCRKAVAASTPPNWPGLIILGLSEFGYSIATSCKTETRLSWPIYDLRDWISALDKAGELKRIKAEADPVLEIAEITDRVSKWGPRGQHGPGGPALLFENVKGYPGAKLLINQFGSERRMRLALDVDSLDEIADRIKYFMDVKSPQGLLDKIKMLPMLAEMGKFFPREVSSGPCKEVIKRDNFSLLDFPILQCWPLDGGRFITLPSVVTKDPKTGKRNVGVYRMQIYDSTSAGMHWQRQKHGAEHYREQMRKAAAAGEAHPVTAALDMMARSSGGSRVAEGKQVAGRMDVAVAIGTEPAMACSRPSSLRRPTSRST